MIMLDFSEMSVLLSEDYEVDHREDSVWQLFADFIKVFIFELCYEDTHLYQGINVLKMLSLIVCISHSD